MEGLQAMEYDPLFLSRIQFAFTISFHILFPSFTIGLAAWLVVLEALWLKTGKEVYFQLAQHSGPRSSPSRSAWASSPASCMSYQFGTNWSALSRHAGNVIGPLMAYEVLTAFFLEAAFLGIMLFGWKRVPRGMHFFATCMVALGTPDLGLLDPVGQQLDADAGRLRMRRRAVLVDRLVADRSSTRPSPIASRTWWPPPILTTAFMVAGIGAWYLLRGASCRVVGHHARAWRWG